MIYVSLTRRGENRIVIDDRCIEKMNLWERWRKEEESLWKKKCAEPTSPTRRDGTGTFTTLSSAPPYECSDINWWYFRCPHVISFCTIFFLAWNSSPLLPIFLMFSWYKSHHSTPKLLFSTLSEHTKHIIHKQFNPHLNSNLSESKNLISIPWINTNAPSFIFSRPVSSLSRVCSINLSHKDAKSKSRIGSGWKKTE